jgi:hypothetical protein
MSVYDIISYFDYVYAYDSLTGPRGTKIMGLISYTFVSARVARNYSFGVENCKQVVNDVKGNYLLVLFCCIIFSL